MSPDNVGENKGKRQRIVLSDKVNVIKEFEKSGISQRLLAEQLFINAMLLLQCLLNKFYLYNVYLMCQIYHMYIMYKNKFMYHQWSL